MNLTGTNGQGIVFLILFATGAGSGLVSYFVSSLVQIIGGKKLRFVCDFFCVLFCGALFYAAAYLANMGQMRFYVIAAFLLGIGCALALGGKLLSQKTIGKISDRFKGSSFYKKLKK